MIFLLLLLLGCVSVPPAYPELILGEQILRPRAGHDGYLTNSHYEVDPISKLNTEIIKSYDFNDAAFRKEANDLDFACKVGDKRFKICMDKPGLCRKYKSGWFSHDEEYLPASNYKLMLDAGTKCFSVNKYSWGAL